jgi:hypothetical protein
VPLQSPYLNLPVSKSSDVLTGFDSATLTLTPCQPSLRSPFGQREAIAPTYFSPITAPSPKNPPFSQYCELL